MARTPSREEIRSAKSPLEGVPEAVRQALLGAVFLLDREELALLSNMATGYHNRWCSRGKMGLENFKRDMRVVMDFMNFSQAAPWTWQPEDFDAWATHVALDRNCRVSTQRAYHRCVREFMAYLLKTPKLVREAKLLTGHTVMQVVTEENNIPHVREQENEAHLSRMTHEQTLHFLATIDEAIAEAIRYRGKDLYPLLRDKAMFFTAYCGALRASEVILMDFDSLQPNPQHPEQGAYGLLQVLGKGHALSGKEPRGVTAIHTLYPALMDWYLTQVRPVYLDNAKDVNERAMFLSERGRRISYNTYNTRLNLMFERAGFDKISGTHTFRRTGLKQIMDITSLPTAQNIAGHKHIHTTSCYVGSEHPTMAIEVNDAINYQLELLTHED